MNSPQRRHEVRLRGLTVMGECHAAGRGPGSVITLRVAVDGLCGARRSCAERMNSPQQLHGVLAYPVRKQDAGARTVFMRPHAQPEPADPASGLDQLDSFYSGSAHPGAPRSRGERKVLCGASLRMTALSRFCKRDWFHAGGRGSSLLRVPSPFLRVLRVMLWGPKRRWTIALLPRCRGGGLTAMTWLRSWMVRRRYTCSSSARTQKP
jgi:hypothetical protein